MRVWSARAAAVMLGLAVFAAGCSNPLGRKYEYEEQIYLSVDGSARVIVDTSIAALVALRNFPDSPSRASVEREEIRKFYTDAGCPDVRVGQPWTRSGRRFVQIRIEADSLAALAACGPLAWSTYSFERTDESIHYMQVVGPPTGRDPASVNWNGSELVAFKLHAPSRIQWHNVRRLEDGEPGKADRGNILTWEQTLADRRAGKPVAMTETGLPAMEVRMGADSILYRTLWLFGGAFVAAALLIGALIWITIRRGRRRAPLKPAA
jgi:hypothetical protein